MPDDNSSVPCSVGDERSPESGILDDKLSSEFSDQPNLNVPMAASVHCKSSSENLFRLTKLRETPLIVLDLDRIDRNVAQIRTAFPGVALFYALKCNPHTAIVARLQSLNVGFEIASPAELRTMLSLGVVADQLSMLSHDQVVSLSATVGRGGGSPAGRGLVRGTAQDRSICTKCGGDGPY